MTAPRPNRTQTAGHSAIVWMLGAVGGYALLPWMVWPGVQDMSPWLFTAVWYVAAGFAELLRASPHADNLDLEALAVHASAVVAALPEDREAGQLAALIREADRP